MVLRTLPVWLTLAFAPGCSLLGSVDELMPVEARIEGGEVDFHDRAFIDAEHVGVAIAFTTEAHSVRLHWGGRSFDVKGSPLWWDQWFYGPILPVIPVLMGAGSAQPYALFTITLESGDPVRLPLERMTAVAIPRRDPSVTAESTPAAVSANSVVVKRPAPPRESGSKNQHPAATETVVTEGAALLTSGSCATVHWPMDNYEIDGFTVSFVLISDRDGRSEETACELRFDHEHSTLLAFVLPIPL